MDMSQYKTKRLKIISLGYATRHETPICLWNGFVFQNQNFTVKNEKKNGEENDFMGKETSLCLWNGFVFLIENFTGLIERVEKIKGGEKVFLCKGPCNII